jgi:lipid II:glycine glycyltransferase (peptidoglycan interpeptide bridge formation enzyme)
MLIAALREPAASPAVTLQPVTRRDQWESLFVQVPFPHFTQTWCYGEGKRAQGWSVERLLFQDEQGPVAVCQVLVRSILGVPLVARINRGPMFLQDAPSTEQQSHVFGALRRRWRFAHRGLLLIAPALPFDEASVALLRACGFRQRRAGGWGSAWIDLEPSLDRIRASFSSKWRNPLNSAIRAGIEVRMRRDPEAFEWMLERHVENMAAKGFTGPEPAFVRAMIAASPDIFWVLQAFEGNEPVSGLLGANLGIRAENFLGWTNDAGRRTGAHNLLLWNAVVEMKAAGSRALDLGGFTTSGKYGGYKRGMKGREYRLTGEWVTL